MNVQDIMNQLLQIDPSQLEGIDGVFLLDLTGDGGGRYSLIVKDNAIELKQDDAPEPNVTLTMAAADFVALSQGQLNPVAAFMQGKIKVSGDMALAMRLQTILT